MATIKTKVKLIREMAAKQLPELTIEQRGFLNARGIAITSHKQPLVIFAEDTPEAETKIRAIAKILDWPIIKITRKIVTDRSQLAAHQL